MSTLEESIGNICYLDVCEQNIINIWADRRTLLNKHNKVINQIKYLYAQNIDKVHKL